MKLRFPKGVSARVSFLRAAQTKTARAGTELADAEPAEVALPRVARHRVGRPNRGAISPALTRLRPGARFEKYAWLPAGVATSAAVVLASVFSGTVQSADVTLVQMGFDPDRAQLITALIIGAVAAAAVTQVVNRTGFAAMLGTCSLGALFGETFGIETQNAIQSTGLTGSFDPGGWILTLVTLVVIGFIAAWAGATLAAAVRPGLVASGVAARDLVRTRRPNLRLAGRPIAALLVLALLAVTVPAFGDMVNFTPDSLMLRGNNQRQGLVPDNSFPDPGSAAQESASPSPTPIAAASGSAVPTPVPSATPGNAPWLAWKPRGSGHVTLVNMSAPWARGGTIDVNVYMPPGYDPAGQRLYPVMYEAPTGLAKWNAATFLVSALDALIDSGAMPAAIAVFIDEASPPISPSECVDMADGRQRLESYISNTVVSYVDQNYRTVRDPLARAIMGMSEGGFCAPMLMLRHPDVYSVSISFSGYFWAAGSGSWNSSRPFLRDKASIDAHSPALLVSKIPNSDRSKLYFIIVAEAGQEFYGPEAAAFEKILDTDGYRYLAVKSCYPHGWTQVRYETPGVFEAWGAQLAINGIW